MVSIRQCADSPLCLVSGPVIFVYLHWLIRHIRLMRIRRHTRRTNRRNHCYHPQQEGKNWKTHRERRRLRYTHMHVSFRLQVWSLSLSDRCVESRRRCGSLRSDSSVSFGHRAFAPLSCLLTSLSRMTCVCVVSRASFDAIRQRSESIRLRLSCLLLSLSAHSAPTTNKQIQIYQRQTTQSGTTQTTKTKKEQQTHEMQSCTYYKYIFSVINLLLCFVSSVWSCGMFETGGVWTVWANSSPLKLILVGVVAIGVSCFVLSPLLTIPSHDNP